MSVTEGTLKAGAEVQVKRSVWTAWLDLVPKQPPHHHHQEKTAVLP